AINTSVRRIGSAISFTEGLRALIEGTMVTNLSCSSPAPRCRCLNKSYHEDRGRHAHGHLRIGVVRGRKAHTARQAQDIAYTSALRQSVFLRCNWRTVPLRS